MAARAPRHAPTAAMVDATDAPMKTVETRLRRATELLAQRLARYRDELPGSASR